MSKSPETKYLYRYIDYNTYDSSDLRISNAVRSGMTTAIECIEFPIIKETPKGYWIDTSLFWGRQDKKFVLKYGRKRFAHETNIQALDSFICRKYTHISRLTASLMRAKAALAKAEWDKKRVKVKVTDQLREVYSTLSVRDQRAINDALGYDLGTTVKKDG